MEIMMKFNHGILMLILLEPDLNEMQRFIFLNYRSGQWVNQLTNQE